MRSLVLILSLILAGCANGNESRTYIDPELESYVQDFVAAGVARNKTVDLNGLVIVLGEVSESESGRCEYPNGQKTITISREFYEPRKANYLTVEIRAVVFHELGHCVLQRGHNDTISNGYPASLMHSHIIGPAAINVPSFVHNWESYLDELFG